MLSKTIPWNDLASSGLSRGGSPLNQGHLILVVCRGEYFTRNSVSPNWICQFFIVCHHIALHCLPCYRVPVFKSDQVPMQSVRFFLQPKVSAAPGGSQMFGGAPYTSYQGHFLVPVKPEVFQLPINQVRVQLMHFIHLGPVNFGTLVFHTGTGQIHKLGFYFNEHIVSIVVLNAMFNNSSNGDRAQFDQVCSIIIKRSRCKLYFQTPELRLFNMQENQKQVAMGRLNQVKIRDTPPGKKLYSLNHRPCI